jgi:hypothetical protein
MEGMLARKAQSLEAYLLYEVLPLPSSNMKSSRFLPLSRGS